MRAKLIGICGSLSTGKTALARNLTSKLNLEGRVAEYVPEAATDYIIECAAPAGVFEQSAILLEQMKREQDRCNLAGVEWVISDCPAILVQAYAIELAREMDANTRKALVDIHRMVGEYVGKYDVLFYIPKERAVVNNGISQFTDKDAKRIDGYVKMMLYLHKIQYETVTGNIEQRVALTYEKLTRRFFK